MGALDGVRVVDLSTLIQGPQAAAMLHDLGAEVIKVELPEVGDLARWITVSDDDPRAPVFEANNRGKRSITLDLRQPGGKRALEKLIETTDVLISNFVPGTLESWGLSYEELSTINPRLVYATGSTYGPEGPLAQREGADTVGQAWGGLISTTGTVDGDPTPIGALIADHSGCQNMVTGILASLLHREKSGEGQRVDVSLFGGMVWAQASELTYTMLHGESLGPSNRGHPLIRGLLRMVPTSDGWIQLVGVPPHLWDGFCRVIDREDLIEQERFRSLFMKVEDLDELRRLVDEIFPTRTTAEWCERLAAEHQRFAPVRNHTEVVADDDAVLNGYLREVDHPEWGTMRTIGSPIRMSATPTAPAVVAPDLGQHTEEVLLEVGFTWEDIAQLQADGAY
ncbi:MAG: CoA transferase [Actinomycetia bacterium]|nr:CoA transferase [Actinomycetes bacterium]MCP4086219.1 CoA transferase [Actinomycetes bacterium]